MFKLPHSCIHLTHYKVMLKILQAIFKSMWTVNVHVQAEFRKGRGTRDEIANIRWITEKAREYQKNISVQFSSVASRVRLCDPINRSTPGLPVHHHLPEFTQTVVHRVRDAIRGSYPRSFPSPPAPNPSQHHSSGASEVLENTDWGQWVWPLKTLERPSQKCARWGNWAWGTRKSFLGVCVCFKKEMIFFKEIIWWHRKSN